MKENVTPTDDERLQRQLNELEKRLPDFAGRTLRWLLKPSSRWVRIPVALLLIVGGFFSFLPILGLWMLPLGLILLVEDLPFLKGPTATALAWVERRWRAFKAWRKARQQK